MIVGFISIPRPAKATSDSTGFEIESGVVYRIKNKKSNLYLDVPGSSKSDGQRLIQWTGTGNRNQDWKISDEGDGKHSIISMDSNKALTVKNNNHQFSQLEYSATRDQIFKLVPVDDQYFKIVTSYNNKVLSVESASTARGKYLFQYSFNGGDHQLWSLEKAPNSVSHEDLVKHYSPRVYQDVRTNGPRGDYFTKFDFDGDWKGNNNWENLVKKNSNNDYTYALPAYVYYSVQETATHYYISYNFFHPRDDADIAGPADKHENDLEGIMVAVKKNGYGYGTFHIMETVSHKDFYQFANDNSLTNGYDDIDHGVRLDGNSHPTIKITSNGVGNGHGHGIKGYQWYGAPGDGGIYYYFNDEESDVDGVLGVAQLPPNDFDSNDDKNYDNRVGYALISLDEIWSRRNDIGEGNTFTSFGTFDGNGHNPDSANAPWNWDDKDDGAVISGMWMSDPAFVMDAHLGNVGNFSHNYIYNKYFSHKVKINTVTSKTNKDPGLTGSKRADIFVQVNVAGKEFIGVQHFKKNNADNHKAYSYSFGGYDAEHKRELQFGDTTRSIYVAKPAGSEVRFEVRDRDSDSDDSMGTIKVSPSAGITTYINRGTSSNQAAINATVYTRIN